LVLGINKAKQRRGLNDSSFVSSSYSKALGFNSTFDDEDEVFNAIIKSKLNHIKQKKIGIPPKLNFKDQNFNKQQINMKTITDKESDLDHPIEESKTENTKLILEKDMMESKETLEYINGLIISV